MNAKVVLQEFKANFSSKRKEEKEAFDIWMKTTYIIMLTVISILFLYYVWITNVNATKWYNMKELRAIQNDLNKDLKILEVQIADLESLSNILNKEDLKNMEKVEDPDYLVIKQWVQYVYKNK